MADGPFVVAQYHHIAVGILARVVPNCEVDTGYFTILLRYEKSGKPGHHNDLEKTQLPHPLAHELWATVHFRLDRIPSRQDSSRCLKAARPCRRECPLPIMDRIKSHQSAADPSTFHTAKEWEGQRKTFQRLYVTEDKSLEKVMEEMYRVHGFHATYVTVSVLVAIDLVSMIYYILTLNPTLTSHSMPPVLSTWNCI